ncbi:MAG: hypothetical protein OXC15_14900 [Rhodospirillaceae bacterium]|nr:hypothetical protein [Rhodospirillaceae bacterium]
MPGPEAWQAFGGVLVVVIFLGAAAVGARRLGLLGARPAASAPAPAPAPAPEADTALPGRVAALESEIANLRLCMAENYVRRDDYITNQSRMIGLLESHSVMLGRLEERIGARQ